MSAEPDTDKEPDFPHWPGDWPGRRFVNLDCVGDPGDWLDLELSSVEEVLSEDPQEDESMAEPLADAYIRAGEDLGFPLPTDFGVTREKMREVAVSDFIGFIREWRKRAEAAGCFTPEAVSQRNSIPTWELLPRLGFVPDPQVISDLLPGLSCNFGNLKLAASCVMNLRFREVVMFTGVLQEERTISGVSFELPRHVESSEQGVAWIVWGLDQAAAGHTFKPKIPVPWFEEGRQHRNTLPWERERAAYAARPQCSVSREWARLALKTLAKHLAKVEDDATVTFRFDGELLSIRCAGKVTAVPADGDPWSQTYSITARLLRHLPRRLAMPQVTVSIWDRALTIGRRLYRGVVAIEQDKHQ